VIPATTGATLMFVAPCFAPAKRKAQARAITHGTHA
jgi:hypothetical protein